MPALTLFTHAFRRAVEIAGYDVPTDPAVGQVIEGGHSACEGERRFVGERDGDAKAEVPCGRRHRWDEKQRIVDRRLRGVQQGRLGTAAKDVVDAENVGEKQTIEEPSLECLREFDPAVETAVIARTIARVAPHSGRLMRDAVHLERVEADFLGHEFCELSRQPAAAFCFERATTLAMISPKGPAFFAGPKSLPVVTLSGSFGNTSSAKR